VKHYAANDNRIACPTSAADFVCPACKAYPGQRCRTNLMPKAQWRATNGASHTHHVERLQELYAKGDAAAGVAIARAILGRRRTR